MKSLKHLTEQPFIVATGLAALVHSTWALGTFFSGPQPEPGRDGWIAYLMWLLPALLIAFALDIGQIATSAELRAGHRTRSKYITFAIFATATYYLQWLYMAHHMPALQLAPGVEASWGHVARPIRDLAVWLIPGLLPASTLLYTFSQGAPESEHDAAPDLRTDNIPVTAPEPLTVEPLAQPEVLALMEPEQISADCPACGKRIGSYGSQRSVDAALRAHSKHCTAVKVEAPAESANA